MDSKDLIKPEAAEAKVVVPLADQVNMFLNLNDTLTELDRQVQEIKALKADVSASILEELKNRQEFSVRLQHGTVTLSVKKTASVVDQKAVVQELKNRGLDGYVEVIEKPNDLFDNVLKEIAKTGETIPGVVIRETEYISVRASAKDERRKVTTEDFKKLI